MPEYDRRKPERDILSSPAGEKLTTIVGIGIPSDKVISLSRTFPLADDAYYAPSQTGETKGNHIARVFQEIPPGAEDTVHIHVGGPLEQREIDIAWEGMKPVFEENEHVNLTLTAEPKVVEIDDSLESVFAAPVDNDFAQRVGVQERIQKKVIDGGFSDRVDVFCSPTEARLAMQPDSEDTEPTFYASVLSSNSTEPRIDHIARHFERLGAAVSTVADEIPLADAIRETTQDLPQQDAILLIDFAGEVDRQELTSEVAPALDTAMDSNPSMHVIFLTKAVDEQMLDTAVGPSFYAIAEHTSEQSYAARGDALLALSSKLNHRAADSQRVHTILSSRVFGDRMANLGTWVENKRSTTA